MCSVAVVQVVPESTDAEFAGADASRTPFIVAQSAVLLISSHWHSGIQIVSPADDGRRWRRLELDQLEENTA